MPSGTWATLDPEAWTTLTRAVTNRDEFLLFLNTSHDLLIDGREEKRAMLKHPWLMLAYHRLRLVRNAFIHGAAKPSLASLLAWDQVYFLEPLQQREWW